MRFRERRGERDDPRSGGSGPTGSDAENPGGDLRRYRRTGEGFLAAGSEAIRRALSDDSEAFLEAVQQEGGQ